MDQGRNPPLWAVLTVFDKVILSQNHRHLFDGRIWGNFGPKGRKNMIVNLPKNTKNLRMINYICYKGFLGSRNQIKKLLW